ncbi:hypothetical protein L2252_14455 [Mesorhizobium muleiense]|nr:MULTISPECIES: hypothetical protein [unclassified Mesorhizobium]MCF6100594.1 hypothetical protein [Mesorhizobium muleiense]
MKGGYRNAHRLSGELDDAIMRRQIVAEDDNRSCHAFVAQNAGFGIPAGRHFGDDRAEALLYEVHEVDRPALLFKAIAQCQFDVLQIRREQGPILLVEQAKKSVSVWGICGVRHCNRRGRNVIGTEMGEGCSIAVGDQAPA